MTVSPDLVRKSGYPGLAWSASSPGFVGSTRYPGLDWETGSADLV